MTKKSLASILKRQWWLHTFLTSVFFIFVTFFLLFVIEDYLNEKQLIDMSKLVASNAAIVDLPAQIKIYAIHEVPPHWLSQLAGLALNQAIELDNPQGDAIHLLRAQFVTSGAEFVLAFDTSKSHSVWSMSDELLIFLLLWIVLFLALAAFMAKKFSRHIQGQLKLLLATIKQSSSPTRLQQFSDKQSIDELAQFAQLFAQVWQQKIDILAREKQGLEYLSHELRTPIQASLATLELLALKTADKKIIDRLSRSLNRMTRLSNAVLYLMGSTKTLATYPVDVLKLCQELAAELQPLADVKQQRIVISTVSNTAAQDTLQTHMAESEGLTINSSKAAATSVKILATREVIETLLSILLTNALQHSDNSPIIIKLSNNQIRIQNHIKPLEASQSATDQGEGHHGFGIGLTIAQRLADKFNLQLSVMFIEQKQVIATISNLPN